jgi:hypothetical protein
MLGFKAQTGWKGEGSKRNKRKGFAFLKRHNQVNSKSSLNSNNQKQCNNMNATNIKPLINFRKTNNVLVFFFRTL